MQIKLSLLLITLSIAFIACQPKETSSLKQEVIKQQVLSENDLYKAKTYRSIEEASKQKDAVYKLLLDYKDLETFPKEILQLPKPKFIGANS